MLSIITPVYNGKRFIEFCINNVIQQVCPDIEHIIIDGGSTDGSLDIIESYGKRFKHIRWISEKDWGQSDAMNKGIMMAQGSIVSFLNVDDYYEPDALRTVLDIFKELPQPSLLVGNCWIWDDNGNRLALNRPAHLDVTQLLTGDDHRFPFPFNPSAYFYHKSLHDIIGMYDTREDYAMDFRFILEAVMHTKPIYTDKVFGNFRLIDGTKTFNEIKSGSDRVRFKKLLSEYRAKMSLFNRLKILYYQSLGKLLYSTQ